MSKLYIPCAMEVLLHCLLMSKLLHTVCHGGLAVLSAAGSVFSILFVFSLMASTKVLGLLDEMEEDELHYSAIASKLSC